MSEQVMLDQGDVEIVPVSPWTCECGEAATHIVNLDLRNNGMTISVESPQCIACANETATRLRASLPPAKA